jgi:hypothetical protein
MSSTAAMTSSSGLPMAFAISRVLSVLQLIEMVPDDVDRY